MKFNNVKIIAEANLEELKISDVEVARICNETKCGMTPYAVLRAWVEEQFKDSKLQVRDVICDEEDEDYED